jgi:hypothetical protein
LSDALPIAVFGHNRTGRGPHDRLGDEGADRFGAWGFLPASNWFATKPAALGSTAA